MQYTWSQILQHAMSRVSVHQSTALNCMVSIMAMYYMQAED